MNTQINVAGETEIWKLQLSQANHLLKSGALPAHFRNPEQVLAVIQYGRELGLPPMTSTQNIQLIQGKPTLSANLIGARLKNAGYKFKVKKYLEEEVSIEFTDLDGEKQTFSYTIEEAKKAGNAGKQNYDKYAVEMLYARCLTRGGRIVAPEVLSGVYAPEEFTTEKVKAEVNEDKPEIEQVQEVKEVEEKEFTDTVSTFTDDLQKDKDIDKAVEDAKLIESGEQYKAKYEEHKAVIEEPKVKEAFKAKFNELKAKAEEEKAKEVEKALDNQFDTAISDAEVVEPKSVVDMSPAEFKAHVKKIIEDATTLEALQEIEEKYVILVQKDKAIKNQLRDKILTFEVKKGA